MRYLLALLLCLLLAGCASEVPTEQEISWEIPQESVATLPAGLYDPESALEARTWGAVRVYPLNFPQVMGMRVMEGGVLLLTGEEHTTLTLLTGEELYPSASVELDFYLDPQDPSIQTENGGVSYFDPVKNQTVVLDAALREVSHIPAPKDLTGTPIVSADREILYYFTPTELRAWNLETGIHRRVKEMAAGDQTVTGLILDGAVVQCRTRKGNRQETLFLSAQTGHMLRSWPGDLRVTSQGQRYYAAFPNGVTTSAVFGQEGGTLQCLLPEALTARWAFLEEDRKAVAYSAEQAGSLRLDCYDLESGLRTAGVTIETQEFPLAVDGRGGMVYLLIPDETYGTLALYRWDTAASAVGDAQVHTGPYYTAREPDREGLERCRSYANQIGQQYGIRIALWEDALAVQPWNYQFEGEYLVPVIWRELERLEQCLAQYPAGMLEKTAGNFSGLQICLVRSIAGTAESGSTESAQSVQFLEGTEAYVAVAAGEMFPQALYHGLFHVMETQILNGSIALDRWTELNPSGFSYDYDYLANAKRQAGVYLGGENRAFVDTYSMSFPKEDRARIMEYAMLPGQEALFRSETMQAKLRKLCEGIREAYGLRRSPEVFPWEQYLTGSLAYGS